MQESLKFNKEMFSYENLIRLLKGQITMKTQAEAPSKKYVNFLPNGEVHSSNLSSRTHLVKVQCQSSRLHTARES